MPATAARVNLSRMPTPNRWSMPKRKPTIPATLALLAVLALAGCGSSAPTKAQYVAKADAICATESAKTAPLIREVTVAASALGTGSANGVPKLASAVSELHDVTATYLAQLQKLEQPSGDHAAIERFLTPFAGVESAIGQAATALHAGQAQKAVGLLVKVQPTAARATSGAREYGLAQCATVLAALG